MLSNSEQISNPDDEAVGSVAPVPAKPAKPVQVTPTEFFQGVSVNCPNAVQGIVTNGRNDTPNDQNWQPPGTDFAAFGALKAQGRKPAYFTMAAFVPETVERFKGRTKINAVAMRGFWIDIEGGAEKYDKPGGAEGGYRDGPEVMKAVVAFMRATSMVPNFLVSTGSGGAHLHYVLCEPISPTEWLGRARALVTLAKLHALKIDAQCTTDAARIMRAPGSIHQKTGNAVLAYRWRAEPYILDEWDRLTNYEPGADTAGGFDALRTSKKYDLAIIGDVVEGTSYPTFSYSQAAEHCPAMHKATLHRGRDTPYPVWILAVKTADLSVEGREYAHSISGGHADYDEATTDKKIDSLTGGPAGCEAWANAYGAGGPCGSCGYRGRIKNPAIQLGARVDTTPPGSVDVTDPEAVPGWVADLNARFAEVRLGTSVLILDQRTPIETPSGIRYGPGYLDLHAFRQMHSGRFADKTLAGTKAPPLANAWLSHPARRQYQGAVFAPGTTTPPSILNLWSGYAVERVAGDISLWLRVLCSVVPDKATRRYVLRWLAYKIQHPGDVPGTILLVMGGKGSGKNSLVEAIVRIFGSHGRVFDDAEQIAGRFTGHLQTVAFAVLDEALFTGNSQQADRIKSRVTATSMTYEAKGRDPVQGVNRCAFVSLSNHAHVWQATVDERRAVVVEAGVELVNDRAFWKQYYEWLDGPGPSALLYHLQNLDLGDFNPRVIPKGDALRRQVEQTALRDPAAAWWCQCLNEGAVRLHDGTTVDMHEVSTTAIPREILRRSYEQSAASRYRTSNDWNAVAKRLNEWAGPAGVRKLRAPATANGAPRGWVDEFPPLPDLKAAFTAATQIEVAP